MMTGFTLVELLVVLVLLSLTFLLVTPALFRSENPAEDPVQRVVDEARRQAVKRAEEVALVFEADGRWVMEAGRASQHEAIGRGTIDWTYAFPARIRISAIGACLLEGPNIPVARFDPVRCRLTP
jgi:prepilin-type N-terminal cleavage/methylation domain-containing protein